MYYYLHVSRLALHIDSIITFWLQELARLTIQCFEIDEVEGPDLFNVHYEYIFFNQAKKRSPRKWQFVGLEIRKSACLHINYKVNLWVTLWSWWVRVKERREVWCVYWRNYVNSVYYVTDQKFRESCASCAGAYSQLPLLLSSNAVGFLAFLADDCKQQQFIELKDN